MYIYIYATISQTLEHRKLIISKPKMTRFSSCLVLLGFVSLVQIHHIVACNDRKSAIGDPGMRREGLRVAIEAWNQCNDVGEEAPNMGSPRLADCFDVDHSKTPGSHLSS